MTPLGKRLDELRKQLGWSWSAFSEECGLTRSHMKLMADSGNVTSKVLAKIRERTRVNLNWLVCGDEDMGIYVTADKQAQAIASRTRRRSPDPTSGAMRAADRAESETDRPPKPTSPGQRAARKG